MWFKMHGERLVYGAVNPAAHDVLFFCFVFLQWYLFKSGLTWCPMKMQNMLFCSDFNDHSDQSVFWTLLSPDQNGVHSSAETSLSLSFGSVQHQPIGVPQTAGFSFQPLQPNILTTPFLTLSSAYQRGHCLWMIVWTLNNSARSWILIMHQTVFLFVQLCLVLKIVSHYRKYICN